MDNNNNKKISTITLIDDVRAKSNLGTFDKWKKSRERLNRILDDAEKKPISDFFCVKVQKKADTMFSAQNMANVTFTSAGAVNNWWRDYENRCLRDQKSPNVLDFILSHLVPLSPEEIKEMAEREKRETEINHCVQSLVKSCTLVGVPVTTDYLLKVKDNVIDMFGVEVYEKIADFAANSDNNNNK